MTNGEKYKTAKERAEAFRKYHDEHHHECRDTPYCDDAINRCVTCLFKWLDLEASAEDPLPCPFCGGVMSIHESDRGWSYLECLNGCCNYKSGEQGNEDAAIAAHNRVARAAKEKEANNANA